MIDRLPSRSAVYNHTNVQNDPLTLRANLSLMKQNLDVVFAHTVFGTFKDLGILTISTFHFLVQFFILVVAC